jgi:hypothetical protein
LVEAEMSTTTITSIRGLLALGHGVSAKRRQVNLVAHDLARLRVLDVDPNRRGGVGGRRGT